MACRFMVADFEISYGPCSALFSVKSEFATYEWIEWRYYLAM